MENSDAATVPGKVAGRRLAGIALLVLAVLGGGTLLTISSVGPSLRTQTSAYEPGDLVDLQLRN